MWLVIGYGNSLYGDDGFGVAVAEELRSRIDEQAVTILTGPLLQPEWMQPISQADGVIFIDATRTLAPGKLQCIDLTTLNHKQPMIASPSSHYHTPHMLLEGAAALYGYAPPAWLYIVGGDTFALGHELSAPVRPMVPHVVSHILEQLSSLSPLQENAAKVRDTSSQNFQTVPLDDG